MDKVLTHAQSFLRQTWSFLTPARPTNLPLSNSTTSNGIVITFYEGVSHLFQFGTIDHYTYNDPIFDLYVAGICINLD